MDDSTIIVIENLKKQLKNCVNELCLRCGNSEAEHLGACNACKWKEIRNNG